MLPFIPLAASAIGSVLGEQALRGIGEAIAGSPTESEARARVVPLFNTAVAKLRAQGMSGADAEKKAADEVQGYVQEEMGKSNMPEWVSGALSLVGLVGGGAVAGKMAAKALGKSAAAKAASAADAAVVDPLKAKAAGAIAEGSGKAAEGAALKSGGVFPPRMSEKTYVNPADAPETGLSLRGAYPSPGPSSPMKSATRWGEPIEQPPIPGMGVRMSADEIAEMDARQAAGGVARQSSSGANRYARSTSDEGPFPRLGTQELRNYDDSRILGGRDTMAGGNSRMDRIGANRRRASMDSVDDEGAAVKAAQMAEMNFSRSKGAVGSKPAYHDRDTIESGVGQDDIDSVIYRLVNGNR